MRFDLVTFHWLQQISLWPEKFPGRSGWEIYKREVRLAFPFRIIYFMLADHETWSAS